MKIHRLINFLFPFKEGDILETVESFTFEDARGQSRTVEKGSLAIVTRIFPERCIELCLFNKDSNLLFLRVEEKFGKRVFRILKRKNETRE